MPISNQLLSKLACPKCTGSLEYERDQEILNCLACRLKFKITGDDIPVLLIDEAEELQ